MDGTGPTGVATFYSALVHAGALYVSLSPGWFRRLPLEGGEPETLLPTSGVQRPSASGDHLCWSVGSYSGPSSVRCASLAAPSFEARELQHVELGGIRAVVVASDAGYWLRGVSNEPSPLELVAVAL